MTARLLRLMSLLGLLAVLASCGGSGGSDGGGASKEGDDGSPSASADPLGGFDAADVVEVADAAVSNVSIDASSDGRTVAVGWYVLDDASGEEQAKVAVSSDGGETFGEPVVVAEPAVEYPQVAVLDDGDILVGAITYDLESLVVPDDPKSWASWPVIYRSGDGGRSFDLDVDLRDQVGPRVLTGTMPTSLGASPDGRTLVFSFQDNTPEEAVDAGAPSRVDGTSAIPTWAMVSTDGGASFGAPQVVADSTCSCCRSSAFVAEGRAGVAMRLLEPVDASSDERNPAMTLADASGRVGEPTPIHDDDYVLELAGCPASGPGVAGSPGLLHAAWWTEAEGREGWWYSEGPTPEQMGEPVRLPAPQSITYAVDLAADQQGRSWVVGMHWPDSKDTRYHLLLWFVDAEEQPTDLGLTPTVDAAAQGYDVTDLPDAGLVAWIDDGVVRVGHLQVP
ncbi:MAG: sialidase family protein [Acidimicrobiales bacterium]